MVTPRNLPEDDDRVPDPAPLQPSERHYTIIESDDITFESEDTFMEAPEDWPPPPDDSGESKK